MDSGKLHYQDGLWHRPSVAELGIPQSVRVAIQSRVGVLPAPARETLLLAAVLGREFNLETLAAASDQDEGTLVDGLERAERALLIEKLSGEPAGTFGFVHTLIPTTLVECAPALQRRRLHRCAAAALEAACPDDSEALAHHYHQAGEAEKATYHLLRAGDRARRLYAHQEAMDYYRQALDLLKREGDLEQVARTQMKLGLTYHNAFNFKAARQACQEGFVLWQQVADVASAESPPPSTHALRMTMLTATATRISTERHQPQQEPLDDHVPAEKKLYIPYLSYRRRRRRPPRRRDCPSPFESDCGWAVGGWGGGACSVC